MWKVGEELPPIEAVCNFKDSPESTELTKVTIIGYYKDFAVYVYGNPETLEYIGMARAPSFIPLEEEDETVNEFIKYGVPKQTAMLLVENGFGKIE